VNFNDPTGYDVGCPASNPMCEESSGYKYQFGRGYRGHDYAVWKEKMEAERNKDPYYIKFSQQQKSNSSKPPVTGPTIISNSSVIPEQKNKPEIRPSQGNKHPDAYIYGAGASFTLPPNSSFNLGLEMVVLHEDHVGIDRSGLFVYAGPGAAYGAGGNVALYTGVIYNLETINDYAGSVGSKGVTASVGEIGVTVSQFGNQSDISGLPYGTIYGWAPGAHLSIGGTVTNYWRIPGW